MGLSSPPAAAGSGVSITGPRLWLALRNTSCWVEQIHNAAGSGIGRISSRRMWLGEKLLSSIWSQSCSCLGGEGTGAEYNRDLGMQPAVV